MCLPHIEILCEKLVPKFRETGSILDKKQRVNKYVLTKEKLEKVEERLEHTP